jgi:flagellar basal-body rod protein FlgB
MIDALFSQTNYVAAKRMLDATALRQEAIASNLANLETPGYKRIDLSPSFHEQLGQAMRGSDITAAASATPSLEVDSAPWPTSRDGNNVQLEHELLQLNQNTLAHTVETHLVNSALLKLKMAITGRTS